MRWGMDGIRQETPGALTASTFTDNYNHVLFVIGYLLLTRYSLVDGSVCFCMTTRTVYEKSWTNHAGLMSQ